MALFVVDFDILMFCLRVAVSGQKRAWEKVTGKFCWADFAPGSKNYSHHLSVFFSHARPAFWSKLLEVLIISSKVCCTFANRLLAGGHYIISSIHKAWHNFRQTAEDTKLKWLQVLSSSTAVAPLL